MPDDGLVTLQSSHDVATTLERLTAALEAKGVRVFARTGATWTEEATLLASDGATSDAFGSVASGLRASKPPSRCDRPRWSYSEIPPLAPR